MTEENRSATAKSRERESDARLGSTPLLLGAAGIGVVALVGAIFGLPAAFLVGAALTLALVIALVWSGLSAIEAEPEKPSLEEALHLAVPMRAEEQKRAVLRTLKDLDYELSVGKISREDYERVSREVREEARKMIARVDEALESKRRAALRIYEEHVEKSPEEASGEAS